jgi:hypothetical protein
MRDKGQKTGGTEYRKQKKKGQEQGNRAIQKWDTGTVDRA